MKPDTSPQLFYKSQLEMEKIKNSILTPEEYKNHPFAKTEGQRSYTFEISRGGKLLSYFGSFHTNKVGDPLFNEINKTFTKVKPQIVLIEGMESINNRKEEIRVMGKKASSEDSVKYGEGGYALKLAIEAGIDFESPEPDFNLEIQMLLSKGYSKKDIFTFYTYRDIFQYQRQNEEKNIEDLKKYLLPHFEKFKLSSGWGEEIDVFVNDIFSDIDLNSDKYEKEVDPIPWEDGKQVITNNISKDSSNFRDKHIVERIAEALKKYDRVLIIYGASHAVMQEPAVRALLA